MAKLADWTGYARRFNGTVSAWINQAEAPKLLADNSQGVCNAIVTDWLASFRGYRSDRMKFIAKFTKRDNNGLLFNANIPDEYIAQQAQLSNELALHRAGLAKRLAQIEASRRRVTLNRRTRPDWPCCFSPSSRLAESIACGS
jgi:hypothetical protein